MNKRWIFTLLAMFGACVQGAWAQNPELPRDLHGLWWQPTDPGWATAVFDHPSAMSSALLTYDWDGKPTWLVAPRLACHRDTPPWLNVECDGAMYKVTAPWFGESFRTQEVRVREVGEWRGNFRVPLFGGTGPDLRRILYLSYTIEGVTTIGQGDRPMRIQAIDPSGDFNWLDGRYSGLWGHPDESGWGVGIFVQNNDLYATLFVHGPDREPRWYVVSAKASDYDDRPDRIFEGNVFETRGYAQTRFPLGATQLLWVGRASLHFGAGADDPASLSYSIDGVQVSKTIVRPAP